ncbi:MAG: hypothetical protein U0230_16875 [Polyangiales bacterium]
MSFVRRLALAAVLLGVLAPVTLSAQTYHNPHRGGGQTATPSDFPGCVKIEGEVRFRGFGYNHIVHVRNECTIPVRCNVATSVDPTPGQDVALAPRQETQIQTRSGSPASTFEPRVTCRPGNR